MNARHTGPGLDDAFEAAGDVAMLRIPPHSIEAESSVLGGLLLDSSAWDRVGDLLTDSDFFRMEHRLVYTAIGALANANRQTDVVAVFDQLQNIGKGDEVGGLRYLNSLAQYVPSASNIRRYAEIVRERSILRQLVSASDEIATAAFNTQGKPVATILDEAQAKVMALSEEGNRDDWDDSDRSIADFLDSLNARATGQAKVAFTPTGLTDLDSILNGGTRPGQLVVIAARPSVGKTALALSIAEHVAGPEVRGAVGVMSMEMEKPELLERRTSMNTRIHLTRIQRPERLNDTDWPKITHAIDSIRQARVSVSDKAGLNINQVRARARAMKRRLGGLELLVVDYLGLMPGIDRKMSRTYQIEEITQGLKMLGKELGCSVVLLVQLSREVEKRVGQRPQMSDLRDSGSIEQDADIVIFINRPHQASPSLGDEWKYYAELIVAKNRNGPLGSVHAQYIGENVRFSDWPQEVELPRSQVRTKGGDL